MNPIDVLIVDDQSLIRAGFSALLSAEEDMRVVGTAASGAEAVRLARSCKPDVVLMDIRMPDGDGIWAAAQITGDPQLQARVVMLTTFELDEYILDSIRAGASGFLVKDTEPAALIEAVRVVAGGDSLLSPSVTRRLLSQIAATPKRELPEEGRLKELTAREREVLVQIGAGKTNAEIAAELFITPLTAKTHVSRIIGKLGVRDRTSLVVLAYESGLITPGG